MNMTSAHIGGACTTDLPRSIAARTRFATASGWPANGGRGNPFRHRRGHEPWFDAHGDQSLGAIAMIEALEISAQPHAAPCSTTRFRPRSPATELRRRAFATAREQAPAGTLAERHRVREVHGQESMSELGILFQAILSRELTGSNDDDVQRRGRLPPDPAPRRTSRVVPDPQTATPTS